MADIFREIEDELRRDNLLKLWQRYGRYIIAAAVVVAAAAALVVGWRQYEARQREAEGVRYSAALALVGQGKDKAAVGAFNAIIANTAGGRAVLARFEAASLEAKSGDVAGAIKLYAAIAANDDNPKIYRDLATLLAARFTLDKDPKQAITRLKPLVDPTNPWYPTAVELTAAAALKTGDKAAALADYQHLADDLKAPAGARARAAEMISALGP